MDVENGAKAAQFPEKEYINSIFTAVDVTLSTPLSSSYYPLPPPNGPLWPCKNEFFIINHGSTI